MPRLDLLVARNTVLSRSQATRVIRAGRLCAADETPLRDPKLNIPPADLPLEVRLDEEPLTLRTQAHVLLHKPTGVVTALKDGKHQTAYSLVREAPLYKDLRAVGRLDLDTSGLLLWTTDGTLLHRLTHPRYQVPRTYHAALDREPAELPDGLTLDDGHVCDIRSLTRLETAAAHPGLRIDEGATHLREIVIVGGKFHEVRRIFESLGATVLGLCRVAYGDLTLPKELAPGSWQPVDPRPVVHGRHPLPVEPS